MSARTQRDPAVQTFSLGDWALQSGKVIPDAFLAYKTYGSAVNPLILFPTWFTGTITAVRVMCSRSDTAAKSPPPPPFFSFFPNPLCLPLTRVSHPPVRLIRSGTCTGERMADQYTFSPTQGA